MAWSFKLQTALVIAILPWFLVSCERYESGPKVRYQFTDFQQSYNQYIADWLEEQKANTTEEIAKVAEKLESEPNHKEKLESRLAILNTDLEKWTYRLSLGDYLRAGKLEDLPENLVWHNGMEQPEIGDPAALKGGTFRKEIPTFPPTIRPFGQNSNNSFRGDIYDMVELPLAPLHPGTMKPIPGVAKQWAISEDKRTFYFKLDPEARYSDGVPVKAVDFQHAAYYRISDFIINPYAKQYFRENIAQIMVYDDRTLSISLPEAQLFGIAIAGELRPSAPHYYKDYGPDYNDRYQWKFPPTTGAYEVLPDDIVMGVSITQTRVKDWWAKDRKFYRYRYNTDKIVHTVVRDESKAFELFRAGLLDTFFLTRPEYWYEKSEMTPVYKGWIERVTFYNQYPRIPRGLYMNVTKAPLDDRNVRVGIHHSLNWRKVIDQMFRGDYKRLNAFNEGFIGLSDPSIKARPYSISDARDAFQLAGFFEEDDSGIFMRADGSRLTVTITYQTHPLLDRIFGILKEDAKACGLEISLENVEATVAYTKVMQKQHQMTFSSWIVTPPIPDFYQFLHSSNAFDERGSLKPQTNNLFVWGRADTDQLSEKVRTGTTVEEVRDAVHKLQQIIHEEAIFAPGYTTEFSRIGSWRWVRWPDSETTRFSPPVVYYLHDSFVYWIDQDLKAETEKARRDGRSFGESTRVVDDYRIIPQKSEP